MYSRSINKIPILVTSPLVPRFYWNKENLNSHRLFNFSICEGPFIGFNYRSNLGVLLYSMDAPNYYGLIDSNGDYIYFYGSPYFWDCFNEFSTQINVFDFEDMDDLDEESDEYYLFNNFLSCRNLLSEELDRKLSSNDLSNIFY